MDVQNKKFINNLASNDLKTRRKSIDSIQQRLKITKKKADYDRIWKGLYYAMWFSDRPLTQQKLADELADIFLIEEIFGNDDKNFEKFIKFSKSFWKVIALEWLNIDYHRINKFLLLLRRVFNRQLEVVVKYNDINKTQEYCDRVLNKFVFSGDKRIYNGIPFHIIDIVKDELVKVMTKLNKKDDEELDSDELAKLIKEANVDPIFKLILDLVNNYHINKDYRTYIKDNLVNDEDLIDYGVIERCYKPQYVSKKDLEQEEEKEEAEAEEWKGF
ncbi:unnamed protein product [Hanseniaspora opuntiae]